MLAGRANSPATSTAMLQLRVEDNGTSCTVPLDRDLVVLGRSKKCTVRLSDPKISSRHCQVFQIDGTWYLQDLRSRNKTFLNDKPLEGRTPIANGDRIAVGTIRIVVGASEAPPAEVIVLAWSGEVAPPEGRDAIEGCGDPPVQPQLRVLRWAWRLALPVWVLSLGVHTGLFGLFTLVYVGVQAVRPKTPVSITLGPLTRDREPDPVTLLNPPAESRVADPGARTEDPLDLAADPMPDLLATPLAPSRDTIGIGGAFSARRVGRSAKDGSGAGVDSEVISGALGWLSRHQRADGSWSCAEFANACPDAKCGGGGEACYDVGVTALAVLAFEGAGYSHMSDGYGENVQRGLKWLASLQDAEGCIGGRDKKYLYAHAIATLAVIQDFHMTKSPMLRQVAQRAVRFVIETQTMGAGWRYIPERKQSDTSVTTWMALCLAAARREGIEVPETAWAGIRIWLLKKTHAGTGRVGYRERDDRGARLADGVEKFPPQEAMAACGLLCRLAAGRKTGDIDVTKKVAERLRACPPTWDDAGTRIDQYYWFFGTLAATSADLGVREVWDPALKRTLAGRQTKEGCGRGSWEPVDPWGRVGGRVYSTAMGALALELLVKGSLEGIRP